jgi:hypothetical protein
MILLIGIQSKINTLNLHSWDRTRYNMSLSSWRKVEVHSPNL